MYWTADTAQCACSKLYTVKYVTQQLASCTGPVLSIIMFQALGDAWKVSYSNLHQPCMTTTMLDWLPSFREQSLLADVPYTNTDRTMA